MKTHACALCGLLLCCSCSSGGGSKDPSIPTSGGTAELDAAVPPPSSQPVEQSCVGAAVPTRVAAVSAEGVLCSTSHATVTRADGKTVRVSLRHGYYPPAASMRPNTDN